MIKAPVSSTSSETELSNEMWSRTLIRARKYSCRAWLRYSVATSAKKSGSNGFWDWKRAARKNWQMTWTCWRCWSSSGGLWCSCGVWWQLRRKKCAAVSQNGCLVSTRPRRRTCTTQKPRKARARRYLSELTTTKTPTLITSTSSLQTTA